MPSAVETIVERSAISRVPPWRSTSAGHAIRCHIPLSELASESLISGHSAIISEQKPEVTT